MNTLKLLFTALVFTLTIQNILLSQTLTQLTINGPNLNYGSFGYSLKNAGDVNGDGYEDFIVGAPTENINTGKAYIFFGGMIIDTIPDIIMSGVSQYSNFGISVSGAGDINGDGFSDVIVGANMFNSYKGRAYVYYGGVNMDNIPDVILNGEASGGSFGGIVAGGDLNNDGFSDLVIAAFSYNTDLFFQAGRVYIYYGDHIMDTVADVVITGESAYSNLGHGTPGMGDVNGDGYCDIVLGAYYFNSGRGRAYVHFGGQNMDNIPDVVFSESGVSHGLGVCVSVVGDVNSDGFNDVVIGNGYTSSTGNAFLFYGGVNMDNEKDKVFTGREANDFYAGTFNCISGAGDINRDGYDDILIGATSNDAERGKVYVYYGGADMDTTADKIFSGENSGENFGNSVSEAGNINGDGSNNFLIGASNSDNGKGKICLYHSTNSNLIYGVYPARNAVNVTKNSDINIIFNKSMNSATINSGNIKIYGSMSGYINSSVLYDAVNRKAIIDPVNDFKTGERINVVLRSGILSSSGDSLDPFGYGFSIESTQGNGNFSQTISVEDTLLNIAIGDLDNDGDVDLVTLGIGYNILINGYRGYHYKVYKNNGQGEFAKTSEFSIGSGYEFDFPWNIKLADFDGDGDLDLLSQTEGLLASLYITLNNGDGTFQDHPVYSRITGTLSGAAVYDIDNDGDNDLIVNTESSGLSSFINNGNAGFSLNGFIVPGVDYSTGFPEVGDFDNDGYGDILYKNRILFNNKNGTFSDTSGIITNNFFEKAVLYDLDKDGDLDIAGSTSPFIVAAFTEILLNNGNGSFELSQSMFNTTVAAGGDFDHDSGPDIDLILKFINDKLYTNNGNGFFNESHAIGNIFPLINTNTADFDQDGDMDLLSPGEFILTSNVRGYVNAVTYLNSNNVGMQYTIYGNTTIPVGSVNNVYVSSAENGYWRISNYDSTQASLQTATENDTVSVSAGNRLGHFVLYYTAHRNNSTDTLLSYHVYVDNPSPVELAEFNYNVKGRDVTLNWKTVSEINNKGFEIERTIDNGQSTIDNWIRTGYVYSNGNGTTNGITEYMFTDRNLNSGNYKYRLKQTDFNGSFEYFELQETVSIGFPDKYSLSQNYPNPFNSTTTIQFGIWSAAADSDFGFVTLKIYDVSGKEIVTLVNENKEPGYYNIKFNATDLSSGVYFYRMTAGDFVAVRKLIVLK